MSVKVAVVPIDGDYPAALQKALALLGGLGGLNSPEREVTMKVGIFDARSLHHSRAEVVQALIDSFDRAPRIRLAESDSYCGKALDRIDHCYHDLLNERVVAHSLSEDPDMRRVTAAGEEMDLSGVLFKPNVFISTHILRTFNRGTILKNLFGCTPMVQKARFHKNEMFANLLADIAQAAGGIDLAVMDATFLYHNATEKRIPINLLVVSFDAVAVEVVGMMIAGLKVESSLTVQEFMRRGLGEGDLSKIEIVGVPLEELAKLKLARRELKKIVESAPRRPGIADTIDCLADEGWLDSFRTAAEVTDALVARGVSNAKKALVETTLKRRAGKTLELVKGENGRGGNLYRRKQG
jgi:uncharacterized protein (DUF362 family)